MEKNMEKIEEKISIRTDLSIADQILGAKMNSDGMWIASELKICGRPTPQAVEEITWAMLEMNKACDLANKGREPLKKKVVKKTVEKTKDEPMKSLLDPKKKTLKLKRLPEDIKLKETPEKTEISGGKTIKTTPGENGEKGKNLSG